MTIKEILAWAIPKLQTLLPNPSLDAEVLLSFVLKKPKEFLYSHPKEKLTSPQIKKFKSLVNYRLKGKPVAYLTNHKEFYGLDFYIDKRVLIPRPETELLVEEVINSVVSGKKKAISIADVGTGSGCIAITLAKNLPKTKVYATDISKPAIAVAKKNARKHGAKVKFFQGNLLQPLKNNLIDIVVANLPYGWKQWQDNTSAKTYSLKFEPQKSIFTKEGGLYLYRQFFRQLGQRKQKPKLIFSEFDSRQKNNLQKLIEKYLPKSQLEIKKDLAGLNRILIIKN